MSLWERLSRHTAPPPDPKPYMTAVRVDPAREHIPRIGTHTADLLPNGGIIQRSQPVLDPNHITRLVAQADASPSQSRTGGNKDGYIHLSSLIGICEREFTISHQHGVPIHKSVSGPMRIIWAIGRAVERHIRNGVIVAKDWNLIHGNWVCRCGQSQHVGLHPKDRTCPVCGRGLHTYQEPLLIDHAARVIGSPDLTTVELGFHLVTEIKSMNKDQFDKLDAPLADHVLQALGYRHLYKLMGYPVLDIVAIVYGRKDFKFGGSRSVYKEYHVHWADYQRRIDNMFAAAARIARANTEGNLLPRVCDSNTCSRAKECERSTLCFSM